MLTVNSRAPTLLFVAPTPNSIASSDSSSRDSGSPRTAPCEVAQKKVGEMGPPAAPRAAMEVSEVPSQERSVTPCEAAEIVPAIADENSLPEGNAGTPVSEAPPAEEGGAAPAAARCVRRSARPRSAPAPAAPLSPQRVSGISKSRRSTRLAPLHEAKAVEDRARAAAAAASEALLQRQAKSLTPTRAALLPKQLSALAQTRKGILPALLAADKAKKAGAGGKAKKAAAVPRADVVYINLGKREDRRRAIEGQLERAGLLDNACRLEACTGDDFRMMLVRRTWDSSLNCVYDTNTIAAKHVMSGGERGCAMSHAVLWHACAARGDDAPPLVVLEDDAVLCAGFARRLTRKLAAVEAAFKPAKRECLLYLGADVQAWRPEKKAVALGENIREAEYLWQTSSYVIWPAAARKLLANLPIEGPVDCFLSLMFLQSKLRAFVVRPRMAWQADAYCNGDINHTNTYVWEADGSDSE